jgi:putative addiction module component (TIGR02574 family)
MSSGFGELFDRAIALPADEREQFALMLLDSLPEDGDAGFVLDSEYEAELERRLEEIRSGRAKGVSIETSMNRLREALGGRLT